MKICACKDRQQGRSQDFHKGGAQLDGVVIGSLRQSRAWPALLMFPLPPKVEAFGILAEQLPNFY